MIVSQFHVTSFTLLNFEAISKSEQTKLTNITNTTTVINTQKNIQIFYKAMFIYELPLHC